MESNEIAQMFKNAGYYVRSYSGRGMYGRSCLGVTTPDMLVMFADVLETVDGCEDDSVMVIADLMRSAVTDSMGQGMIVYWPNIEPPSQEDSEDEE